MLRVVAAKHLPLSLALLSVLLGAATVCSAAPLTYEVNRTVGAATVIGEFTTDGTLGNLAASHFLSWNLTLSEAGSSFTLNETNSIVIGPTGTNAVQATALQVTYDPSVGSFFDFFNSINAFWCFQASTGQCTHAGAAGEGVRVPGNTDILTSVAGLEVVATRQSETVPEPASLVLFAFGVAGIAGMGFSRRKQA